MTNALNALIEQRTSPEGQAVQEGEKDRLRAGITAMPSAPVPPPPVLVPSHEWVDEDVMNDLLLMAVRGHRVLPGDPKLAEVAKRVWAEYDEFRRQGQGILLPKQTLGNRPPTGTHG